MEVLPRLDSEILGLIIDRAYELYELYELARAYRGQQCQEGASLEGGDYGRFCFKRKDRLKTWPKISKASVFGSVARYRFSQ